MENEPFAEIQLDAEGNKVVKFRKDTTLEQLRIVFNNPRLFLYDQLYIADPAYALVPGFRYRICNQSEFESQPSGSSNGSNK